jgi:hypothetical protein
MKTKILFIILTFLPILCLAQGLEISYPRISGVQPARASPYLYTLYVFYFALGFVGILAFISLVFSGLQYVSSAGDPEVKKRAKERIWAALFGILILAFVIIILRTVKPENLFLREVTFPTVNVGVVFPTSPESGGMRDPLEHIHRTAQDMILALQLGLNNLIGNFKDLLKNCTCGNARSLCNYDGKSCSPLKCTGDPCLNRDKIRGAEIAFKLKIEEILFYGRLLEDAKENLKLEILSIQPKNDIEAALLKTKLDALKKLIEELKPLLEKLKQQVLDLAPIGRECKDPATECNGSCELSSGDPPKCEAKNCEPQDKELCPMDQLNSLTNEINTTISDLMGKLIVIRAFQL